MVLDCCHAALPGLGLARLSGKRARLVQAHKKFPELITLVHFAKGCQDFSFLPTSGLSIQPLKAELLAGEQKATE